MGQSWGCSTMAWEMRGKGFYYYRKHRIGNRVFSEYMGTGARGAIAEEEDTSERLEWNIKSNSAQEINKFLSDLQMMELTLVRAEKSNRSFITLSLLDLGYYKHHREWRKSRWKNKTIPTISQR